jgi:hypothetical protein
MVKRKRPERDANAREQEERRRETFSWITDVF